MAPLFFMRILSIYLVILMLASTSAAQSARIRIASDRKGGVVVYSGKKSAVIDIKKEIGGCAYLEPGPLKSELDSRGCAAPPAGFELIDSSRRGAAIYLLFVARAFGNCNVCAMCGASGTLTLFWLHLDGNLKASEQKSMVIENCIDGLEVTEPKASGGGEDDFFGRRFSFPKKGVLTIKSRRTRYSADGLASETFYFLRFDRDNPQKGFQVTEEPVLLPSTPKNI